MSEYYGYFNGLEYDEKFVALVNKILVKNGVFDNGLMVSANGGMGVNVAAGAAIMDGFLYYNDEPKPLTIGTAHAILPRIDSIMLRWNISAASINAVVVEGTPQSNPVAPAPVRSSTTFDFQLATVRINAGVGSITAANITDTRPDQTVCGITSGYNGVNIDAMMTQYTTEFGEWFEAVKGQLSEDAAGNLQNQLDVHIGDEGVHIVGGKVKGDLEVEGGLTANQDAVFHKSICCPIGKYCLIPNPIKADAYPLFRPGNYRMGRPLSSFIDSCFPAPACFCPYTYHRIITALPEAVVHQIQPSVSSLATFRAICQV